MHKQDRILLLGTGAALAWLLGMIFVVTLGLIGLGLLVALIVLGLRIAVELDAWLLRRRLIYIGTIPVTLDTVQRYGPAILEREQETHRIGAKQVPHELTLTIENNGRVTRSPGAYQSGGQVANDAGYILDLFNLGWDTAAIAQQTGLPAQQVEGAIRGGWGNVPV